MTEQKTFTWLFDDVGNASQNRQDDSVPVNDVPSEYISCLRFCPSADVFAITSWDHQIACYTYDVNDLSAEVIESNQHKRAALCCCWDSSGKYLFSGGCDNKVNQWHISGNFKTLGHHKASVKCMEYSKHYNVLISGSWDHSVKIRDIRCNSNGRSCYNLNVGSKVYAISCGGNAFVVGLSNKFIQHYDFRKLPKFISSLPIGSKQKVAYSRTDTVRDIQILPDNSGYVWSVMEGRCGVLYFDDDNCNFSWKCHRLRHPVRANVTDAWDVYSVNAVRLNWKYGTFVTGGDDGKLFAWDINSRSKLYSFIPAEQGNCEQVSPITSVDFDRNGNIMGYAVSNSWDKGHEYCDKHLPKPEIRLQKVGPQQFDTNVRRH